MPSSGPQTPTNRYTLFICHCQAMSVIVFENYSCPPSSSRSRGVPRGPWPPSPVEISHKKDGRQRRSHRFHVSWPPHPAAGSDAAPLPLVDPLLLESQSCGSSHEYTLKTDNSLKNKEKGRYVYSHLDYH